MLTSLVLLWLSAPLSRVLLVLQRRRSYRNASAWDRMPSRAIPLTAYGRVPAPKQDPFVIPSEDEVNALFHDSMRTTAVLRGSFASHG